MSEEKICQNCGAHLGVEPFVEGGHICPSKAASKAVVITKENIPIARLLVIKGRLKLEMAGIKFRGRSTFSIVKEEFGFNGNKQKVFDQYMAMLKEKGYIE